MVDVINNLNWVAIIVATLAYFIFGGLWFSPAVFGKAWDKAIGFERPEQWKPGAIYYFGPLLGCLAASVATAVLMVALDMESLSGAIILGLVTGTGYAASVTFTNAISPGTPHPLQYGILVSTYHIYRYHPYSGYYFYVDLNFDGTIKKTGTS